MLILSSKTLVEHQVNEYDPRGESGQKPQSSGWTESDICKIGPYEFSKQSFVEAISELQQGFEKEVKYLVFDEIGNLELKKKQGLWPILEELLPKRLEKPHVKFIFVVRPSLREAFLTQFQINEEEVSHFTENPEIIQKYRLSEEEMQKIEN